MNRFFLVVAFAVAFAVLTGSQPVVAQFYVDHDCTNSWHPHAHDGADQYVECDSDSVNNVNDPAIVSGWCNFTVGGGSFLSHGNGQCDGGICYITGGFTCVGKKVDYAMYGCDGAVSMRIGASGARCETQTGALQNCECRRDGNGNQYLTGNSCS